jgi:hypothetical protein
MHIQEVVVWINSVMDPESFQCGSICLPIMVSDTWYFLLGEVDFFSHILEDPVPDLIPEAIGGWIKGGIQIKKQGRERHMGIIP